MEKHHPRQTQIILLIAGLLSASALLLSLCDKNEATNQVEIEIGRCHFQVEIAASPFSQYQGLSGRRRLESNQGMLFIFSDLQKRTFVMRKMHFPLDILYIYSGEVREVLADIPPEGKNYSRKYPSQEEVDMALEINAGQAASCGIESGSKINFIINNHGQEE